MNKDEEDKLVNAIIDLQQSMEKQLGKINLGIQELRLSYMKLDESFNKYAESNNGIVNNHETRIVRLEPRVLGGGSSFVAKQRTEYKKRKKK